MDNNSNRDLLIISPEEQAILDEGYNSYSLVVSSHGQIVEQYIGADVYCRFAKMCNLKAVLVSSVPIASDVELEVAFDEPQPENVARLYVDSDTWPGTICSGPMKRIGYLGFDPNQLDPVVDIVQMVVSIGRDLNQSLPLMFHEPIIDLPSDNPQISHLTNSMHCAMKRYRDAMSECDFCGGLTPIVEMFNAIVEQLQKEECTALLRHGNSQESLKLGCAIIYAIVTIVQDLVRALHPFLPRLTAEWLQLLEDTHLLRRCVESEYNPIADLGSESGGSKTL